MQPETIQERTEASFYLWRMCKSRTARSPGSAEMQAEKGMGNCMLDALLVSEDNIRYCFSNSSDLW